MGDIYHKKAKLLPIDETARRVVKGTNRPSRGRGNVSCSVCGEPVKETEMKEHLRKKHHRKNPVVAEGPAPGREKRFDAGFVHDDPRAEPPHDPPKRRCICGWCKREMPIKEINRHTRRRHQGKEKWVKMTSDDPLWNDR